MSRLYIVQDLSPSAHGLFATLRTNRGLLEKCGICLAPFFKWSLELIPSHAWFFTPEPSEKPIPPWQLEMRKTLEAQLNAGHDALLMVNCANIQGSRSFERLWRDSTSLPAHETRILLIIGRPSVSLEQRYRENVVSLSDEKGRAHVKNYASLSLLIREIRQKWPDTRIIPNLAESPLSLLQTEIIARVFDFLGVSGYSQLQHSPRHPLFLNSDSGRRFCCASEIRKNAWPPLDEDLFMDVLCGLDQQWGCDILSPKSLREKLNDDGKEDLRALENMLELEAGALACPAWLASQKEIVSAAPLPQDRVEAFVKALPLEVREALRKRFSVDAHLHTPAQKALNKALCARNAPDYTVIGEPVPPVELTVMTMTYNHEKYIAQCMDSVLMQKTSFSVRHLVLDHHSADGTGEIIASYAARHPSIQPVLLSAHMRAENALGLFLRCRSKYAALCDGDDYFTDPLKLQKQVDYLEKNSRCAICFHPVAVLFENGEQPGVIPSPDMLPRGWRYQYYLADLVKGNFIQTNSVVYRWRFQEGLPDWFRADLCPADWYWHLLHAETGSIHLMPEIMSVYRRHEKAMFKASFADPVGHRRIYGMDELETYHTVNEHFKGRYFDRLYPLAMGVFENFLSIYVKEANSELLDRACSRYPDFAQNFLSSLKIAPVKKALLVHS